MALFESYERRIDKINGCSRRVRHLPPLKSAEDITPCRRHRLRQDRSAKSSRSALKTLSGHTPSALPSPSRRAAKRLPKPLRPSVSASRRSASPVPLRTDRKVGLGHGNLGAMLLREETKCFCFLAGHESFAAAEGAIGIARNANKARQGAPARYPERPRQGRRADHLPYQRLYLRRDGV